MIATVTPATRIGLSLRPTTWMSASATGPGVLAMTTSATACTGVARSLSSPVDDLGGRDPGQPGHGAREREPVERGVGHDSMFAHAPPTGRVRGPYGSATA